MATAYGSLIFSHHLQASFLRKENDNSVMLRAKTTQVEMGISSVLYRKTKNKSSCRAAAMEKSGIFDLQNSLSTGKLVQHGMVYRQNVVIKSFEIGFDGKASITALMSHLQDTFINHLRIARIMADDHVLGVTQEMCSRDLIWVLSSLQIVVDRYPSWLDVVEVETWMYRSGRNGLGLDWIIRDTETNSIIAQATGLFVLMNKKTRKLSKFHDEITQELAPHMLESCNPILDNRNAKNPLQFDVDKADFYRAGLKPGWSDLDANQHVNNVKYINWILESIPKPLMERYELSTVKLKYQKECNMDSVLQSLSKTITNNANEVEMEHLLLLENGMLIVRGCTTWKPKHYAN